MLRGVTVGHGVAYNPCGAGVHFQLIKPYGAEPGAGRDVVEWNLAEIEREQDRWGAEDEAIDKVKNQLAPGVSSRSYFATICLKQVHDNVDAGICCALVAQANDGRILGVMTYFPRRNVDLAIGLLAIDPVHLAGSPGKCQFRGIGTSMVAAVSRQALAIDADTILLHPLDVAAHRFWTGRGFRDCGGALCVAGRQPVEALINGCNIEPDCPDRGQCVVCGEARSGAPSLKVPQQPRDEDRWTIVFHPWTPELEWVQLDNRDAGWFRQMLDGTWGGRVAGDTTKVITGFHTREEVIDGIKAGYRYYYG